MARHAEDPIVLHELLHAYHAKLMPNGYDNKGIKGFFGYAKAKSLLPKDTYALKNDREFFAVTASIFLAGKELVHDPKTRAELKEKMPDYYKFLVELFGFLSGSGHRHTGRFRRVEARAVERPGAMSPAARHTPRGPPIAATTRLHRLADHKPTLSRYVQRNHSKQ